MKKGIKATLVIGLLSVLIVGFICSYLQIGFFSQDFKTNNQSTDDTPLLIAHAGGLLQTGRTQLADIKEDVNYHRATNAQEAFELSYEQGIRYFEGDLVFTTDHQLILRHSWGDYIYDISGQEKPADLVSNSSREFDDITGRPMFETKHVMTGHGIIDFLEKNKDAKFILDIKAEDDNGNKLYQEVLEELKRLTGANESIMKRFIPQAYSLEDLDLIHSFFDFPEVWLTLYRYGGSNEDILNNIKKGRINAIVCGQDVYDKHQTLLTEVKKLDTPIYMNTINQLDTFNAYIEDGIKGVYTDGIRQTEEGFITIDKTNQLKDY